MEEKKNGIPEGYIQITDIQQKQKLLTVLLQAFHELCEKHGLIYSMHGGTLLGAVRHHGFIPWDDDVDVTMPRDQYNRFLEIVRTEYTEKLNLHAWPDENYIYPFAKLGMKDTILIEELVKKKYQRLTLNMDVFPNDGYPDDPATLQMYGNYEQDIIITTYDIPFYTWKNFPQMAIKKAVHRIHGYRYYLKKQIDLISSNSLKGNEYTCCIGGADAETGARCKVPQEEYYNRALYDFEGIKVWGMRNADLLLRQIYGDYMTLPPEEKRVSPHSGTVWISPAVYERYLNNG